MKAMKKIILLALVSLIMVGCSENCKQSPRELDGTNIYIIDSCEYVGWNIGFRSGVLAHKGNCRYCKERRQKELKEQFKEDFGL